MSKKQELNSHGENKKEAKTLVTDVYSPKKKPTDDGSNSHGEKKASAPKLVLSEEEQRKATYNARQKASNSLLPK